MRFKRLRELRHTRPALLRRHDLQREGNRMQYGNLSRVWRARRAMLHEYPRVLVWDVHLGHMRLA